MINKKMLKEQKAELNEKAIISKTKEIYDLFKKVKKLPEKSKRKDIVEQLKQFEFQLQELWNFERDIKKHRYWYLIPHCRCPKMDNDDCFGINRRIINLECPWHGKSSEE